MSNVIPYRGYDYLSPNDPTVDTNPDVPYLKWLNTTTGEEFVCIDNTTDENKWTGKDNDIGMIPREGLILEWIDTYNQSAKESTGFSSNGVLTKAQSVIENDRLHILDFDGADDSTQDKIKFPIAIDFNSDFSVSMWVITGVTQTNTGSSVRAFLGTDVNMAGGDGPCFYILGDTISTFTCETGGSGNTLQVVDYSPVGLTHFAITCSSNVWNMYLNGVLEDTLTSSTDFINIPTELWVGASYNSSYHRRFEGGIGSVRLYNRGLSQAEITALYKEGT